MNTKKVDGTTEAGIIMTYIFGGLSMVILLLSIIGLVFPILAIVYANKLQKGDEKSRTIAGVMAILGAGIVPGILILVGKPLPGAATSQTDAQPQWNNQAQWNNQPPQWNNQQPQWSQPKPFDKTAEIEKIGNMLKNGSITQDEFDKLKADILKK